MEIKSVKDPSFRAYGKVVENVDFTELCERLLKNVEVTDAVAYEPSVEALEAVSNFEDIKTKLFGGLPMEIGYCAGHNHLLNGLEYHYSSEINVAATDAILILGKRQDITDDLTYDTALTEIFFVPAGTAVELYATTLHYAPCGADGVEGFNVGVILPAGTNWALDEAEKGQSPMLAAKNKWLLMHPEGNPDPGAHIGLIGENVSVLKG